MGIVSIDAGDEVDAELGDEIASSDMVKLGTGDANSSWLIASVDPLTEFAQPAKGESTSRANGKLSRKPSPTSFTSLRRRRFRKRTCVVEGRRLARTSIAGTWINIGKVERIRVVGEDARPAS